MSESNETMTRYCPGCGSVGPVPDTYRDCCPDGNEARTIPTALAEKCRDTFKIAIRKMLDEPVAPSTETSGDQAPSDDPHAAWENTLGPDYERNNESHDDIASDVVQMVCDMDDRSSPEDQPDMMLVTGPELHNFVMVALERAELRAAPQLSERKAQPVSDDGADGLSLASALHRLEGANDALCAMRTPDQYDAMLMTGQQDALIELDDARRDARAALSASQAHGKSEAVAYPELPAPLEISWPELHSEALGCGVEDRGLRDRYECAEYGWQDGVDRAAQCVPDQIFDAEQMRAYVDADRDQRRHADAELARDLKSAVDASSELRKQLTLMEEQVKGEVWRWQGDGADELASMGNRMAVLIYACDLRNLLAQRPAAPAADAAPISRAEWIAEATRYYVAAGDDVSVAAECARALCREQDWDSEDNLAEPFNAAMEDIRGWAADAAVVAVPNDVLALAKEHGRLRYEEALRRAEGRKVTAGSLSVAADAVLDEIRDALVTSSSNPSQSTGDSVRVESNAAFLSEADAADLTRFQETAEDDQSYDIPKDRVKRLAALGALTSEGFGRYSVTSFGRMCLGSEFARRPLETVDECNARLGREHAFKLAQQAAPAAEGGA